MTLGELIPLLVLAVCAAFVLGLRRGGWMDRRIARDVTGLPWRKEYAGRESRRRALSGLCDAVRSGQMTFDSACRAYKQTVGASYLHDPTDWLDDLHNAAMAHIRSQFRDGGYAA